jgi:hypothetical protein
MYSGIKFDGAEENDVKGYFWLSDPVLPVVLKPV